MLYNHIARVNGMPHTVWSRTALQILLVFGGAWLARSGPITFNPPSDTPGPFALWDFSTSLRADVGHRENVLLSATNLHSSGFITLGGDLFLFRLPVDGTSFNVLFSAEDRRYANAADGSTNGPGASKEQTFLTHASLRKPLANQWTVSLKALHLYADQVFDASYEVDTASTLEVGLGTIQAQGHHLALTPALRRDFGPGFWGELSTPIIRQYYRAPISSFWEGGPKLTVGWSYRTNSSVEILLSAMRRPYDDRFQISRIGAANPNLSLTTDDLKAEVAWRHTWDAESRWQSVARLFYVHRVENGSGWFDMDRLGTILSGSYRISKWTFRGTARWLTFDFPLQRASPFDLATRTRDELEFDGRIEYRLHEKWLLNVAYQNEHIRSNVPLDDYRANTVSAGIEFEF